MIRSAMTDRERRLGLNEAVFREVNDRIGDLSEQFGLAPQDLDLICECGDRDCAERISMPAADYERVRADSLQFAIVPGHEDAAVEIVISHEKTYDVVRKRPGEPAMIAEETDPRQH
jgi:hypothetical protein